MTQQQKNGKDQQGVADFTGQGRSGDGGDRQISPPGQLTAQIGRADADQRDAHRLFQRQDQDQHQRKMDDQGIELLCGTLPEDQPAWGLDQQEQRAQDNDQSLLPAVLPPTCTGGAQKKPVDQYQTIVKRAQRGQK